MRLTLSMQTTAALVMFALGVGLSARNADAAEATTTETSSQSESSTAAFPKGQEYLTLKGAFQNERSGEDQYLATAAFGWGHYFLDNAAFEIQLLGYGTHDEEDALGAGANMLARYHFFNFGGNKLSIYGDVLGGIFVVSDDFPTGGTGFNFTYGGGPGVSVKLGEGVFLDGGVRFQHVSNGFIEGRDKNPIFNSFGGYVGVTWWK